MASRIIVKGKTYYASKDYQDYARPIRTAKQSLPKVDLAPIPASSPESPFRAGVPFFDEDDQIYYRLVRRCDPREGWATTRFFQDRWGIPHRTVCDLVSSGFLDAAIEEGSQVRRYRCRDETRVLHSKPYLKAKARQNQWRNSRNQVLSHKPNIRSR